MSVLYTNVDLEAFARNIKGKLAANEHVLNEHYSELINLFGGMDQVLYLCLSNPECNRRFNQEKFDRLSNILKLTDIIDTSNEYRSNHTPVSDVHSDNKTVDEQPTDIHTDNKYLNIASQTPTPPANNNIEDVKTNTKDNVIFSN